MKTNRLRTIWTVILAVFLISMQVAIIAFAKEDDYIFPHSSTAYLSDNDLQGKTLQEINYGKNEIYARHGRKFKSIELMEYFNSKNWYQGTIEPENFDDSLFNEIERYNIDFLHAVEFERTENGYQLDQPGYEYRSVLEQSSVSNPSYPDFSYDAFERYGLADIDGDGEKELIAVTAYNKIVFIYSKVNGRLQLMGEKICSVSDNKVEYNPSLHQMILHQHGGTGLSGKDLYELEDGTLRLIQSVETYSTEENGKSVVYYSKLQEGEYVSISEDEYTKIYETYFSGFKVIQLKENTQENRNIDFPS